MNATPVSKRTHSNKAKATQIRTTVTNPKLPRLSPISSARGKQASWAS